MTEMSESTSCPESSTTLAQEGSTTLAQEGSTTITPEGSTTITQEDSQLDDEYSLQYFGFLPQSFINGMYNLVCEYLKEAMTALNDSILNTFKGQVSETELKEVSCKQGQIAVDRLNNKFDKAELYLQNNVFMIPRHLVLPEDAPQIDNPCTQQQMEALDTDIQTVVDRIMAVKYASCQLRERMKQIKVLQDEFDTSLDTVTKMRNEVCSQTPEVVHTAKNLQYVTELVENFNLDTHKLSQE